METQINMKPPCCVVGLHKREQGPTGDKGIPGLSQGDEPDPVSHQDGGQCGRAAAGDI